MKNRYMLAGLLFAAVVPGSLHAQTLWDRRDPNFAYMFHDYRARNVGDVLTIMIDEVTGSDAQEKREMEKKTAANFQAGGKGSSSALGQLMRSFAGDLDIESASQRKFDGKANTTIQRNFTDKLSVLVIGVMPNGNLVVEGSRHRAIARENRTLRIRGIVRPSDIGPFNTVQSQYVANLHVAYEGRGPETNFTNQGWGGRIFNVLWPH
jgi:flagellar L-ring protein precursor FlgH